MCHVLVIEDEPLIAGYVGYIAESAGATSVAYGWLETEAIAAAETCVPNVILSDVNLKEGGTGPRAVEAIRGEAGDLPVIYIAGPPEERERCEYAASILDKPLEEQRIRRVFIKVAPRFSDWPAPMLAAPNPCLPAQHPRPY